ncbi:hypothetical protein AWB61_14920 [Chromobacterium sp. F49]|nr:hypothetical protein Cv017_16495 [Chromobacterium subtsugae]KZE86784.1 hypothetical protein AWB61_14920 [Chromobacterium sp. F49]OBU84669.1 hypothetical protein MY55_20555 [Chromobacterium subtsugae]
MAALAAAAGWSMAASAGINDCGTTYAVINSGFDMRGTNGSINYIGASTPNQLMISGNVNGMQVTRYIDLVGFTVSGSWGNLAGAAWPGGGITSLVINGKEMDISGWSHLPGQGAGSVMTTAKIVFAGNVSFGYNSAGVANANSRINYLAPFPAGGAHANKGLMLGGTTYSNGVPNGSFMGGSAMDCPAAK